MPSSAGAPIAPLGRHVLAYLGDVVAANLLYGLFLLGGSRPSAGERGWLILLVYLVEVAVLVSLTGQSLGHRLAGIRVVKVDGRAPGAGAGVLRTLLVGLLVPALLRTADGRGLHDRLSGTVAVVSR